MGSVTHNRHDPTRVPAWKKLDEAMTKEKKREQFDEWTVLSNGPSIKDLVREDLPPDPPIVAINHAVMHKVIRADVWAVHENHSGIWETLILKAGGPRQDGPLGETWIASGHYDHWNTWVKGERSHRRMATLDLVPHPNRTKDWAYRNIPWPNSGVAWGSRTIFAAIGHAILRGAKLIRCFGIDMEGAHNSGGEPAQEEVRRVRDGKKWNERWDRERELWDLMVSEGLNNGVEIIREPAV